MKNPSTNFLALSRYIKKHILAENIHYFVFDNVTRIINKKLFKKILALKYQLRSRIRVIMICDGFPPYTKFRDNFILNAGEFLWYLMPIPTKEHIAIIVYEKMDNLVHPEIFEYFIDLIYQSFSHYIIDIGFYVYLTRQLYPAFIQNAKPELIKAKEFHKLYDEKFRRMGRDLVANLYVSIGKPNMIEKRKCQEFASDEIAEAYGRFTISHLTYLQGILLVSAYIACHTPTYFDQRYYLKKRLYKR